MDPPTGFVQLSTVEDKIKVFDGVFIIDLLSYLSYQIKWYEHKSLLTYLVAYTDYSAKRVLLDCLATICIINFLSLFPPFQQSQPLNN